MNALLHNPPVLGIAAWSGTGKTTLLTKLLPLLSAHGLRVGMIKHAHHEFDIDHPGKDSYELRKAGAEQMLIASSKRWALMARMRCAITTSTPGTGVPCQSSESPTFLTARWSSISTSAPLSARRGSRSSPLKKVRITLILPG